MKMLIEPFTIMIQSTASLFNHNYGMAIIILTLLIRFLLAPLMVRQSVRQFDTKQKMDRLKPELSQIQKKMADAASPEEKQKLQMEMMALYKKHGINPLSAVGCLPILIQMPLLMGFYYAIRSSKEIAAHHFLWFSLGHTDLTLTIIAGIVYFVQFKVSQKLLIPASGSEAPNHSMQWIGLISPIMIVFASLSTSAALPLYWVVGGLFLIVQTCITSALLHQRMKNVSVVQQS